MRSRDYVAAQGKETRGKRAWWRERIGGLTHKMDIVILCNQYVLAFGAICAPQRPYVVSVCKNFLLTDMTRLMAG